MSHQERSRRPRGSALSVFSSSPHLQVRSLFSTTEGETNQQVFFNLIDTQWQDQLSESNGVTFFLAKNNNHTLFVEPTPIEILSRMTGHFKEKSIHALVVFDNNSLATLVELEMTTWLLPPVTLIAFGFSPDLDGIGLLTNSPIRNIIQLELDTTKQQVFEHITSRQPSAPSENTNNQRLNRRRFCGCVMM